MSEKCYVMGTALYKVCAFGKPDLQIFSFKTRETTEEMIGIAVCKAKAQMEEGARNGSGWQS